MSVRASLATLRRAGNFSRGRKLILQEAVPWAVKTLKPLVSSNFEHLVLALEVDEP